MKNKLDLLNGQRVGVNANTESTPNFSLTGTLVAYQDHLEGLYGVKVAGGGYCEFKATDVERISEWENMQLIYLK